MAYAASIPAIQSEHLGKVIGTGQCVAFVETAANAPTTIHWKRGTKVTEDLSLPSGTAIATFDPDGAYGNHTDGRSHAAIYVSQDSSGVQVYDQWLGQPVHARTIRFHNPDENAKPVNDGNAYYVVE